MEKPTYNQQGKSSGERDWKANLNWVTDPKGLPRSHRLCRSVWKTPCQFRTKKIKKKDCQ
ncbi:MAG: hypothetical protein IPL33_08870 [Sphingobacteriales bacterium]|nr:hypothetical protein [Sphingobacteriales bacterium]